MLPGVSVHLVGGHTAGLQVVRVETAAGPVVLASDACHFYENLSADRPSPIVHSTPAAYAAFDRVRELAAPDGVVIPGHDPEVIERVPAAVDRARRSHPLMGGSQRYGSEEQRHER